MKLTIVLLTVGFLNVYASGVSQNVTFSGKNVSLETIFSSVKQQTGFVFLYGEPVLQAAMPVTVSASGMPIKDFLQEIFKDQPLKYSIKGKSIFISPKSTLADRQPPTSGSGEMHADTLRKTASGVVKGPDGEPIAGATVMVKGTKNGTSTNASGIFIIDFNEGQSIVITSIGYKKREIRLKNDNTVLNIILELDEENIGAVVINTGIMKKDKASFTGAASVYSGAELKAIGNRNILESLKSLDPSFIKVEDNLQGSNPNARPNFEIRGQTTINTNTVNEQFAQDPNQPLFILDGFETTLDIIRDIDMNRVESITILKDAASTALFGSRAANGVIVVETKRPIPGKLQLSYTTDLSFEMPDLTSYNLMNAEEKLEYERLQGHYEVFGPGRWTSQLKYNERLEEVRRGVNTYWLNEPVRTGLSQRQSLQVTGGNEDLMFNAALSMAKELGVMKGSSRETWGANVGITYRKGNLSLNNLLNLTGTEGNESPYGGFSNYANAIPYFRKTAPDGTISEQLDPEFEPAMMNPLYNASLVRINQTKSFTFFNNLGLTYTFSNRIRLDAALQLSKGNSTFTEFVPPEDTRFTGVELTRRGTYSNTSGQDFSYSANLMLSYGEVIGKNQFSAAIRGDIIEENGERRGFSATGFPYGSNGSPMYAFGYTPFGVPLATDAKTRSVGALVNLGYVYDLRFMLDATYRLDGTTAFGSEKIFKPFGSVGIGWNLHQEPFLKGATAINLLKLRANVGYTGNENLGQFSSVSTYTFQTGSQNAFGQGIDVASLGNPLLDWQQTLQWSYGADFALWKSRISGFVEYFTKETDPLTVSTDGVLPSSVGLNSDYVINVGRLITKGWQFSLRLQPINIPSKRIVWNVALTGSAMKSVYGGLNDRLSKLNDEQIKNKGMLRFSDGYSPTDLWTVVSRGVDPATGNELFQKKDGSLSFIYTTDDIVRVGDGRPKAEGRINTSFTYGEWTIGAVIAYRVGAYIFNTALYNRVENISNSRINLDKRALTSRWQEPGDVTQFTNIRNTSANLTSRFIQQDNQFIGESINMSWRTYGKWLKKLKLQSLSVTAYLVDIFRLEKIQTERGLNYPYARRASLSLNVSF